MKNLLKNKVVIQAVLLITILGLVSTPVGKQYADKVQPLIENLINL